MLFARRKGADLKAEEIFRKIKLEESIEARDKNTRKSGLILPPGYREDSFGGKKIVTTDDIRKQRAHLNGHMLKSGDYTLRCSQYLEEIYEEFLRMFQLASEASKEGKIMRTQSGTIVTGMTFTNWVWENKMTAIWRKKDLKRQFKGGRISKEMWDFHEEIRRKSIEYCDRYLKSTEKQQITMV